MQRLKILHLTSTFFPTYTGGKEVFVSNMIKNIPEADHAVMIHDGEGSIPYQHDGITVYVLPLAKTASPHKAHFSKVFDEVPGFEEILSSFRPDIVHFHDQSSHASLTHLRICKFRNIKTVLTYHSPGQSCLQGSLLYQGKMPCDGWIDLTRCTYCRYRVRGLPTAAAAVASRLAIPAAGKVMLRTTTGLFISSWREFYEGVDVIQIHAHWVGDLLRLNDVKAEKIRYIEMGGTPTQSVIEKSREPGPIRLVFLGRCTDIKGIHLLIGAVLDLPAQYDVEVHFFGAPWDETAYGRDLKGKVAGNPRFKTPVLLAPEEVAARLTEMDVCVIPSLWPETGPLVLFDAYGAQLPVVGTRHAGIAERVQHDINGLLFEWGNQDDLKHQLEVLLTGTKLQQLRDNIKTNRTFAQMAGDLKELYRSL